MLGDSATGKTGEQEPKFNLISIPIIKLFQLRDVIP
jgi:hypothetical protein